MQAADGFCRNFLRPRAVVCLYDPKEAIESSLTLSLRLLPLLVALTWREARPCCREAPLAEAPLPLVLPDFIEEQGLRTPTGPLAGKFYTRFIRGSGAKFSTTPPLIRRTALYSNARSTAPRSGGGSRSPLGCSITPRVRATNAFRPLPSSVWKRSARCLRCSTRC